MLFSKLTHKCLDKWHEKKNYLIQNKFMVFLTLANSIFIILILTGTLSLGNLKAKSITIYGGENHDTKGSCKFGVYENVMNADLLVNDVASWGSMYGWYMGCDGAFYMRGLIRQIRPLTVDETKRLSDKNYVRDYAKFDKGDVWGFDWNTQKYIFTKKNKLLAYIDDDGITGISQKEVERIKKEVKAELIKELKGKNVVCGKE